MTFENYQKPQDEDENEYDMDDFYEQPNPVQEFRTQLREVRKSQSKSFERLQRLKNIKDFVNADTVCNMSPPPKVMKMRVEGIWQPPRCKTRQGGT